MRFIHAADIHLDSPLRGLKRYEGAPVEALSGATRQALVRLICLCLTERIDFLLLAGDLYDGDWQDYNTGLFFTRQMGRLREAGIPVFLIRGNHDAESRITRQLRLPDNVHCFGTRHAETVVREDLGVAIHGHSFATQAVTANLSRAYPAPCPQLFNIGLLHTSVEGRPDHDSYAPCSREDLAARGYDYWALGHVHTREVIAQGEPWIVFPGNLQGRHIRETGAKGCTLVEVDEHGTATLEPRTLEVVRWCRCEIEAAPAATADELLQQAATALEAAGRAAGECLVAARVIFHGASAAHPALVSRPEAFVAELRALANELGQVWIERVELATRSPLDLEAMARGSDPLGQLIRATRTLRDDAAGLETLGAVLQDLRGRLPPELLERILPKEGEAEILRTVLSEVEQLLVPRLVEQMENP